MNKGLAIGVIVVILVVIGYLLISIVGEKSESSEDAEEDSIKVVSPEENKVEIMKKDIIEITSSGFSPGTLEIKQGETVKFVNKDSNEHWPASAVHPTHTIYPNSDIRKCGTDEEKNIFDACRGLKQEEEYSFKFDMKGSWKYHDHLAPGLRGTIIVN